MRHAAIALTSLFAFALLAVSTFRSQEILFGRELPARRSRALRWLGWGTLLSSLIVAVSALSVALGVVAWFGHIAMSAGLVFLGLVAWDRGSAR